MAKHLPFWSGVDNIPFKKRVFGIGPADLGDPNPCGAFWIYPAQMSDLSETTRSNFHFLFVDGTKNDWALEARFEPEFHFSPWKSKWVVNCWSLLLTSIKKWLT